MKEIWYFKKENGKITWYFPQLHDWEYKIEKSKKTRSLKSNSYYWWFVLSYIIETYKDYWYIHTKDELHEIFKTAFIPKKRVYWDFSKKYVMRKWSTTELNTKQFTDYIKMIESIFEFWHMEKLWLEKIEKFVVPDISQDELLYRESKIV